jgi:hypothetical protein
VDYTAFDHVRKTPLALAQQLNWTHYLYTLISDEGTPMKPTLSAKIANG